MLVISSLSYHISTYCGTSTFWLFIFTYAFVSRFISSLTSLMLSTRSRMESIFIVDPLSNIIQFFICSFYSTFSWDTALLPNLLLPFMIPFQNGDFIIVTFIFVFMFLLALICLFINDHILHLIIYPPATLWLALVFVCLWKMTLFSTAVTFSFARFFYDVSGITEIVSSILSLDFS